MQILFALVVACGWPLLVYRSGGWIRRHKAEHRQRLIAAGYAERNKPRRLRGDRYIRIGAIAYAAIAVIAFAGIYNALPPMMNGFAMVIAASVLSTILAIVPAVFIYVIVMLYGELTDVRGDIALAMRDNEFYIPGQPIVPKGQFGDTKLLDAIKEGLTNPAAFVIPSRRIVTEEVAK